MDYAMPVNDQDARALTYLACRLRTETYGCNKWDEPGAHAVFADELIGQSLAVSIERVLAHSCDPEARTPGAIKRPFNPDRQQASRPLEHLAPHERCGICSKSQAACEANPWGEHDFRPDIRTPNDYDISPVVAEIKGHIADHTHPAAEEER